MTCVISINKNQLQKTILCVMFVLETLSLTGWLAVGALWASFTPLWVWRQGLCDQVFVDHTLHTLVVGSSTFNGFKSRHIVKRVLVTFLLLWSNTLKMQLQGDGLFGVTVQSSQEVQALEARENWIQSQKEKGECRAHSLFSKSAHSWRAYLSWRWSLPGVSRSLSLGWL